MMAYLRHISRYLLLGKNHFILSHAENKRVLLTGQLCLISFVVSFSYFVIDLALGFIGFWSLQLLCAALSLLSLVLNRSGRFEVARIFLWVTVNFTVFIFATSEPIQTGLYMYFITATIGALAVYGVEERYKALIFVALSTVLFFISIFYKHIIVPTPVPYTADYVVTNIIINFIGASCASASIIYFLMGINHHSETVLRKNEKDMVQKNAELTQLNAELDRFVYSTSHDLRAPLSSIRGLLQLIGMTDDPAEVKNYIAFIGTRVDDLDKFIREIADYARNVKQQVITEAVNAHDLVRDALETLRFFPESKSVRVFLDIGDDLEINGDRLRLQMIMNNLISNAFKYKDNDKDENHVRIKINMEADRAIFSVEDNGIGIPDGSLHQIFDMYTRAHEHSHGSGLGLYIVKETVDRLKGCVSVRSKEGEGTCFVVEIPNSYNVSPPPNQVANL